MRTDNVPPATRAADFTLLIGDASRLGSEEFGMRALWRDFGFTLSTLFAVVMIIVFAFFQLRLNLS
jgi:hypothetical protein